MHDDIIRYSIDGEIDETRIVQSKARLIQELESQMRDDGIVPSLDLDPQWSLDFNGERYQFALTVYGVYVGENEAWQTEGTTSGKRIMKPTPPTKSNQS